MLELIAPGGDNSLAFWAIRRTPMRHVRNSGQQRKSEMLETLPEHLDMSFDGRRIDFIPFAGRPNNEFEWRLEPVQIEQILWIAKKRRIAHTSANMSCDSRLRRWSWRRVSFFWFRYAETMIGIGVRSRVHKPGLWYRREHRHRCEEEIIGESVRFQDADIKV